MWMTGKPSAQRQFGRQENIRAPKPSRTQEDCAEPDFYKDFWRFSRSTQHWAQSGTDEK